MRKWTRIGLMVVVIGSLSPSMGHSADYWVAPRGRDLEEAAGEQDPGLRSYLQRIMSRPGIACMCWTGTMSAST